MKASARKILGRAARRYGALVLLTLIGGTAGGGYGALKTPTYVAQAYVVVTSEPGESIAALNYAQAYGRIATKGPVAEKAAAILGSTRELARVTAATSPDAPVIEITATGPSAGRTATVANTVAQALVDVGATRKEQTRVGLAVLAPAAVPAVPASPKPPLELAVGAAGGLLIGGLATLAGVGRPRRRDGGATGDALAAGTGPRLPAPRYEVTEFDPQLALTAFLTPATPDRPVPTADPLTPDRAVPVTAARPVPTAPATPTTPDRPAPATPVATATSADQPLVADRIVGRAVVIYREQR